MLTSLAVFALLACAPSRPPQCTPCAAGSPQAVFLRNPVTPGVPITAADVELRPTTLAPSDGFVAVDAVIGRVPTEPLLAGEPVRNARLAAPEAGTGASALLGAGRSSVSIADPLASTLQVGDYVQIWAAPGCTIATAAKVVDTGADSIGVALVPSEVAALADAQATGRVWLAARNPIDVVDDGPPCPARSP